MKLAIVFDDLIQKGGAERVLEEISDIFPDAPIYTSVASKEWKNSFSEKGRVLKTSFLQNFPFAVKLNRFYSVLLLHILAFESFDFTDFDIVLSFSSRYAHFIVTKPSTKHICFMNSPGRMFWEPFDYFKYETFSLPALLRSLAKFLLTLPLFYIRLADYYSSKKVDKFYANSITSKKRINKYYGRDADVIYPFVDVKKFENVKTEVGDYYVVITRLVSWKKVDIAIKACEDVNEKLKVIGSGPDTNRLKTLSNGNTDFLGYIGDEMKMELIRKCKAVIVTQKEDFGIVALEAMACGKPVIAFGEGGATETIVPGITGEFFYEQTSLSLEKVIKDFNPADYSPDSCKEQASHFDKSIFQKEIRRIINV